MVNRVHHIADAHATMPMGLSNVRRGSIDMDTVPNDIYPANFRKNYSRKALDKEVDALNLFRHLNKSVDIRDFQKRILELVKPLGIDDFSHHQFNIVGQSGAVLDPFGTYSEGFINSYTREEFYRIDYALKHVQNSEKGICQSTIDTHVKSSPYEDRVDRRNADLARFFALYRVSDSYNFGIAEDDYRATMSYSSGRMTPEVFREMIGQYEPGLRILGGFVDKIGRKKFKSHFHNVKTNPRISLKNPAAITILDFMARKDLSVDEVAEVIGLSPSTARYHLQAAKQAFGTHTNHGTLLAAYQEGVLDIIDE